MGTNRLLCFLLFCVVGLVANAQSMRVLGHPADELSNRWGNTVAIDAGFDYNANSLLNEFVLGIYQGQYLDRDLRERTRSALRTRNSVGYALHARISWTGSDSLFGHAQWRPIISIAHHEQLGARFTQDLYAFTFFGNAGFEGRRADLGPSAFTRTQYQTAGFGIRDDRTGSFIRMDVVNGQSIDEADVRWAGIYTGVDGRVIRGAILADYFHSDTAGGNLGRNNGIGAAITGRWAIRLDRSGTPAWLNVAVEDFGFVRWNANAVSIQKDTVIAFSGLDVASILDLDAVLVGEDQLLDTFGLRYRTGPFVRALPFRASVQLAAPLGDRWYGRATLDQRNLPGYVPQLAFAVDRTFPSGILIGTELSMGGLGRLRAGVAIRKRFNDRVEVSLFSPNVPGFFHGRSRGAGAFLNVEFGF